MSNPPVIAILGATGAVGQHVVKLLACEAQLRVGCRRLPLQRLPGVEYRSLDLADNLSLREFCRGSDMIINCATAGHLSGDSLACIAMEYGIDYLTPGGDDALYAAVKGKVPRATRCIVSAGMLPGLSGLLPRLLMPGMRNISNIQGYALCCEPFSRGGATDFLASFNSHYGMAGLSLQQGKLQPAQVIESCQLPLAYNTAQALPFITSEWQRLAADCASPQAGWFNLFIPGEMTQWLNRRKRGNSADNDVEQLMALSLADCAGHPSQHVIAVEVSGEVMGEPVTRAQVVSVRHGSELTAAVTAYTARLCLAQQLPTGLHYAAEILPAGDTLAALRQYVPGMQLLTLPQLFACEEGAL